MIQVEIPFLHGALFMSFLLTMVFGIEKDEELTLIMGLITTVLFLAVKFSSQN